MKNNNINNLIKIINIKLKQNLKLKQLKDIENEILIEQQNLYKLLNKFNIYNNLENYKKEKFKYKLTSFLKSLCSLKDRFFINLMNMEDFIFTSNKRILTEKEKKFPLEENNENFQKIIIKYLNIKNQLIDFQKIYVIGKNNNIHFLMQTAHRGLILENFFNKSFLIGFDFLDKLFNILQEIIKVIINQ